MSDRFQVPRQVCVVTKKKVPTSAYSRCARVPFYSQICSRITDSTTLLVCS